MNSNQQQQPQQVVSSRYSQYRYPFPGEPLPVPMKGDEGLLGISVIYMLLTLLITPFLATPLAWFKVNLPKRRAAAIIGSGVGSLLFSIGLLAGYIIYDILDLQDDVYYLLRALSYGLVIWSITLLIFGVKILRRRKMLERSSVHPSA